MSDRDSYLVRDIAEALLDRAGDELVRMGSGHVPAGVRRLACLLGVHNEAMSSGLGAALTDTSAQRWGEAIRACDELGLSDVAALLRRLDPQQPDVDLTVGLQGEYFRLTSAGTWHGDDAIRSALRRRVEQAPSEYGVQGTPPPPPSGRYDDLRPTGSGAFLRGLAARPPTERRPSRRGG
ncbi:hypothetical protein KOI35_37740 [Actinoplanes bogorensis]|uniref:DUF222 domain-containing protein n=1 Tax=Paractinoplanes bogorensis TaxID=1610840 RepID=A0ABS5Z4C4_9ACTN|nr:hypothetical protein [Actinoplanes bogorensis]MBU2669270.1 hypothetical protein [Actinoplanes bogorensis]